MPSALAKLRDQLLAALPILNYLRMNEANRIKLYETAYSFLDKDASPADKAPDEYACAESVNDIIKAAFGTAFYNGNQLSTYYLRKALRESKSFKQVFIPAPGDVVISPTGYGSNPEMPNGHVGIVMQGGDIASNDSRNGLFRINYTIQSWANRYVKKGGFPQEFYRPL
jgi:hypothetical protein